jgi:N-acetyl-anhydromuramyl-L-alanine amidase AmpD
MPRFAQGRLLYFTLLLAVSPVGLASAQSGGSGQSQANPGQPRASFTQARHYRAGSRTKDTIKRVVLHTIEGPAVAAKNWFQNPEAKVSAHYIVDFDGGILQMVLDKDVAWHVRNNNSDTIGIEHAGYAGRNQWTQAQIHASAKLVGLICSDYEIEPSESTVVSHAALDPSRRSDPGAYFPWSQYMQLVKQAKQQADQAKENGGAPPRLDGGGLSSAQGSGNPSGSTFQDGSRSTGSAGGAAGSGSGTGSGLASGGSGSQPSSGGRSTRDVAGEVIGQALDTLLGDQGTGGSSGGQRGRGATPPGGSSPSGGGLTARGGGSVNGGYGTLAASSPASSSAGSAAGSSARNDSGGRRDPSANERSEPSSRPDDRRRAPGYGEQPREPKRRPAPGQPGHGTTSADDTEDDIGEDQVGSSYGGARRGPGLGGDWSRRGQGQPGDARRERDRTRPKASKQKQVERAASRGEPLGRELTVALRTLKELGYKNAVGAGILASLLEETNLDTGILVGDPSNVLAAGIGYWTGPGLDALWAAAQQQGTDWRDLRFQLGHLDGELKRDFRSLRRRLRQSPSPETAARIFASGLFELDRVDHDDELDRRAKLARQLFEGRLGPETDRVDRSNRVDRARARPRAKSWDDF